MTLTALAPAPPETVRVLAAARDLASGTVITAEQVTDLALPPDAVPDRALRRREQLVGQVLAAPVRRGETMTDLRLVGPSLVAAFGDHLVAAPVRIADAATVALVAPGDVIDVLAAAAPDVATGSTSSTARVVAAGVPVLVVPQEKGSEFGGGGVESGALVVVAADDVVAARLASAAVTSRLSVVIRPPGQ
jgi:Flp pilus assembly protein CpaB